MEIEKLARKNISEIVPYSASRDECGLSSRILLDSNENPFDNGYNRYPDPFCSRLKSVYSSIIGVNSENIFAGNGSDEAIDLLVRVFCEPGRDNIIFMSPSYGMYKTSAMINGVDFIEVPLKEDFSLNPEVVLQAVNNQTKIIFLCSPNNPTGNSLNKKDINQIIEQFKGLVVVDEAYIDFSSEDGYVSCINRFENLVVLRTLSKAWGMAGVRVGFAVAPRVVIGLLNNIKQPYNVNVLSQAKAIELLTKGNKKQVEAILNERDRLAVVLNSLPEVIDVYPSDANFLLVRIRESRKVYKDLMSRGVVLRDISYNKWCESTLRISIGTQSENNLLIEALKGAGNPGPLSFIEKARCTKETMISLRIDPLGKMDNEIITGIPFFDHMLEQLPVHAGFSMRLIAEGDLKNGAHHTIEDIAIVLGESLSDLISSESSNNRYGFSLPMDESSAMVMVDFGKRAYLQWDVLFPVPYIESVESDMFRHFFDTLSKAMNASIHIRSNGLNAHHMIEAIFKSFTKSLEMIMNDRFESYKLKSSKGVL